jgi:hypothetical protein
MEVFGSEGAFTASVVGRFTAFQLAGNTDGDKVSHF